MIKDTESTVKILDENTRRYYLELMGIQCWQLLDADDQQADATRTDVSPLEVNRDVTPDGTVWPQLEKNIQQCNKCPLHKTRKQALVGRGNQTAELMFILFSAEVNDDTSAELCSGEAKELLAKMLTAINISLNDVYITSLLKCSVPSRYTVSANELEQCNNYLKQQIQLIQPKLIIVLGETASRCLLQKDASLDELRELINTDLGKSTSISNQLESVPLFVSYSPQELLQQPENKRKAWLDLQQIQKIMQR